MSKIVMGTAHGKTVGFDTNLLLAGRLLITADSGGGKSWLARVLFEQAFGKLQTIVIDPEGEFASLREKYPFVLAGKGGDTPIDVRSAGMLAHRLLKLRVSAVCDLYELRSDLRHLWVKSFLEALIEAPKELRTPILLGMDELHMFAPEKGQGESEAKQAVIDVATRGRKRGICLGGITQRLAMLDKNVTSQLQNRLIGPTFEEVNIKTAVRLLGIAPGKEEREFHKEIQLLEPGNFFALGRAISRERILLHVRSVETTHPKAFEKHTAPLPPTPDKIKDLLPQLADLPAEAEKKAQTEAEYKREIRELKAQLQNTQRLVNAANVKPGADPAAVREFRQQAQSSARIAEQFRSLLEEAMKITAKINAIGFDGVDVKPEEIAAAIEKAAAEVGRIAAKKIAAKRSELENLQAEVNRLIAKLNAKLGDDKLTITLDVVKNEPVSVRTASPAPERRQLSPSNGSESDGSMTPGERAILIAIAQFQSVDRDQLTVLTGYKRSTRDKYIQLLAQRGYVSSGSGPVSITQQGIDALGSDYEPLPTGEELQRFWLDRLSGGERQIFEFLLSQDGPVDRDAITEGVGLKRSTRDKYLQHLASRCIIERQPGAVELTPMILGERVA